MKTNKKQYILVGSNNFWYAIEDSKKEAIRVRKAILNEDGDYSDPESGYIPDTPSEVYIYEAKEV